MKISVCRSVKILFCEEYYLVELCENQEIPDTRDFVSQKDNCNVVIGWMPIEELQNVIKIVKYNANIKRHTSLNILKTFVEDGFIDEAKGAFVDFQWDKYTVKSKGVVKEYAYDKTFIEALVKAHSDMAADSTNAIAAFVKFANID